MRKNLLKKMFEGNFSRKFYSFFTNDDTNAYSTKTSLLERIMRNNIGDKSVVRAGRNRLNSASNIKLKRVKLRSHSCPAYNTGDMVKDINRLCTEIKKKTSQARWDIYNLSGHAYIDILLGTSSEIYPMVGMYPATIISDSEMTIHGIKKLLSGAKKVEAEF